MKISRFLGITLMLLGSLAFTFFAVLALVSALSLKYDTEALPNELSEVLGKFLSNDLTSTNPTKVYGITLASGQPIAETASEMVDFLFALSISMTLIGIGFIFGSIASAFSTLAFASTFTITIVLLIGIVLGGAFENNELSEMGTTHLSGAALVASPLIAMFVGGFFQIAHFIMRKRYRN